MVHASTHAISLALRARARARASPEHAQGGTVVGCVRVSSRRAGAQPWQRQACRMRRAPVLAGCRDAHIAATQQGAALRRAIAAQPPRVQHYKARIGTLTL